MEKTGNEIIAEFMGRDALTRVYRGKIVPYIPDYDTLWDLLMPVVEKIESMTNVHVIIKGNRCRIMVGKKVFVCHTISKLNSMYRVVIEFIEWHNQVNQNNKS